MVCRSALIIIERECVKERRKPQKFASEKILCRLGFKKEAVLRGRRMNMSTGERNDMVICSITREEMESGSIR